MHREMLWSVESRAAGIAQGGQLNCACRGDLRSGGDTSVGRERLAPAARCRAVPRRAGDANPRPSASPDQV